MLTKILSGVIAVLILAVGILAWQLEVKIKDLAHEQYKNAHLESSLSLQNSTIEKLKIDSEAFKQKATETQEALNKKYNAILSQNKDLQKKLSQVKIAYNASVNASATKNEVLTPTTCLNELLAYKETLGVSISLLKNRLEK